VRMVVPEQFFYKDIKGQVSNTQYQKTSTKSAKNIVVLL
jgi:hypothetical protein